MKFVVQENREEKAKKIEAVLQDATGGDVAGLRILDIGIGNGEIAEYFARRNQVDGVDVLDQRSHPRSSVRFSLVRDEELPLEDGSFDVVISNHVIEHTPNQEKHLKEIGRTLKRSGICYLATPNVLFPWECHHKTWLIHYGGSKCYHRYLKWRGIYEEPLYLLSHRSVKNLALNHFHVQEYTHRIIKEPARFGFYVPFLNRLPLALLACLNWASQTNVFVLYRK